MRWETVVAVLSVKRSKVCKHDSNCKFANNVVFE